MNSGLLSVPFSGQSTTADFANLEDTAQESERRRHFPNRSQKRDHLAKRVSKSALEDDTYSHGTRVFVLIMGGQSQSER